MDNAASADSQMQYYSSPVLFQRGRGLGGVLTSLFRGAVKILNKPSVQKGLKRIGRHTMKVGANALEQVLDPQNPTPIKEAIKRSAKKQFVDLLNDTERPRPSSSNNIKRPRKTSTVVRNVRAVSRDRPRTRKDIFDKL